MEKDHWVTVFHLFVKDFDKGISSTPIWSQYVGLYAPWVGVAEDESKVKEALFICNQKLEERWKMYEFVCICICIHFIA